MGDSVAATDAGFSVAEKIIGETARGIPVVLILVGVVRGCIGGTEKRDSVKRIVIGRSRYGPVVVDYRSFSRVIEGRDEIGV